MPRAAGRLLRDTGTPCLLLSLGLRSCPLPTSWVMNTTTSRCRDFSWSWHACSSPLLWGARKMCWKAQGVRGSSRAALLAVCAHTYRIPLYTQETSITFQYVAGLWRQVELLHVTSIDDTLSKVALVCIYSCKMYDQGCLGLGCWDGQSVLIRSLMVQVLTPVQAALLEVQVRPSHFWVSIKAC